MGDRLEHAYPPILIKNRGKDVMREQANFIQPYIGKCVLSLVIAVGLVSTSFAAQFDAPYYELEKKHGAGADSAALCGIRLSGC